MLELKRSYLDNCTIGKMFFKGEFVCYTVERPWLNNEKNVSCIPAGEYHLSEYHSSKFPDCFSLLSLPLGVGLTEKFQRTHILIHPGNFPHDVQGCISPGRFLNNTGWGVAQSRLAMGELRELIKNRRIEQIKIS